MQAREAYQEAQGGERAVAITLTEMQWLAGLVDVLLTQRNGNPWDAGALKLTLGEAQVDARLNGGAKDV